MAYKYIISDSAKFDFERLRQYFIESVSENYANEISDSILKEIRETCKTPKIFQIRPEQYYAQQKVRTILIKGISIFYQVDDEKQKLRIVRIRSQKQDNRKLKFD